MGALMLTISIHHPDAEEFILKKQDLTKVTGANISVKVSDKFMEAVKNNEDFLQTFPIDLDTTGAELFDNNYNELIRFGDGYIKKIKALDLWNKLIHCAWNTAEPGIMFEDHHWNFSPDGVYPELRMVSTNPCQPAWATVLTPNGIRTFTDIEIGDKIWSTEGWTTIINKINSGNKNVYEYRTTAGSFYGTENHRLVSNGIKIEAKNAESMDILTGEIPSVVHHHQDIMDGLVIGDGSFTGNLIYLCIGKMDMSYMESSIASLIKSHKIKIKDYAYEIDTTITKEELPLTYLRSIPKRFIEATPCTVCGFLKGLYSANGSVVDNRVTLKTSSPKLRDEVQLLLSSVGIRSYYTTNTARDTIFDNGTYTCKESYDINITSDRDVFYNNIGFLQPYKMEKLKNSIGVLIKGSKTHDIIKTTHISIEEVYDITVDNPSHTYWTGGVNVSNCGEIGMQPFDSCRLIHEVLSSYVINPFTKDAYFDYVKYSQDAYDATILADVLIDLELIAVDKILHKLRSDRDNDTQLEINLWTKVYEAAKRSRRAGIGFTGLGDVFAMLGIRYGSKESLNLIDEIFHTKMQSELQSSVDMAILYGTFTDYNKDLEYIDGIGQNAFYKNLKTLFPEEVERMIQFGRRNLSWSTAAPTGSVSILTQSTSGIEPIFSPYYQRKKKCMRTTDRVDFVDDVGEKFTVYNIIHRPFIHWACLTYPGITPELMETMSIGALDTLFAHSPWKDSTANDLDYTERLKVQQYVQKYTTHSISSTINLPKETKDSVIDSIYREAYDLNLKGVTVYRDQCRAGILTIGNNNSNKGLPETVAPKRPKELPAELTVVTIKSIKYAIIVGLYENRPYEIFAFDLPTELLGIKNCKGKILKQKKRVYTFISETVNIDNLELAYDNNIEKKAFTLTTSMSLRHGVPIKYILKTLDKIDDHITSYSKAITRVLSTYIPKEVISSEVCPECGETLVRENGCIHCSSCSYSKC